MIVQELYVKTILSKSKIYDYTINPYFGCEYGCTYCYARFMKRFTGHKEKWGEFVDVKVNAITRLQREITKKPAGNVWISGVCDPYQQLEKKYELTRGCLEILSRHDWPVILQTKSPLVLRDTNLIHTFKEIEVGFTITTADENIRRIFEPSSPLISERIRALEKLHSTGIKTFAMIAPLLPGAKELATQLNGTVDHVLIDRQNYHYANWVYKKYQLEYALSESFFTQKKMELSKAFRKERIPYQFLF
jgi:DNA repair photolyase